MDKKYDEWPSSQKLKKADGTIAYIWDNKFHDPVLFLTTSLNSLLLYLIPYK